MRKYVIPVVCILFSVLLLLFPLLSQPKQHINAHPNLPAPIGKEDILFTSAGQAVDGAIAYSIAEDLHLNGDYRPRALATDLYDYSSLVITVGYSPTGLVNTRRNIAEEKIRVKKLLDEARQTGVPVLLLHLSGKNHDNKQTRELIELAIPYVNYFVGLKEIPNRDDIVELLQKNGVRFTLVNELDDIRTPFNSAFR